MDLRIIIALEAIVPKIDPELKKQAAKTAGKLAVSISSAFNNELRGFTGEQSAAFEVPEAPNATTAAQLTASRKDIEAGDYHHFDDNGTSLDFLAREL